MISNINGRSKKPAFSGLQRDNKDNKENLSSNLQHHNRLQPLPNKISKIRASLGPLVPLVPKVQALEQTMNKLYIDPKQQLQEMHLVLKRQYSSQTKKDYSQDILSHIISKNADLTSVLSKHLITPQLRAKMVDWMIEVISSYKMSEQCFFLSVRYMDMLFKKCERKLEVSDLHLVGVVSMFVASKYEQIYPFKLNIIYDKICRKKFTKEQLLKMQEQIMLAMQFQLQQVTSFYIIQHILYQMNLPLDTKKEQYLKKVCIYLAKMSMHYSELAWVENNLLAASVIFIGLKTVEQVDNTINADDYMDIIGKYANVGTRELLVCSQQLLNLAQNFNKIYPSLSNLKKFNNAQYCQ